LLDRLRKWCRGTMEGYEKRSQHDQLIDKEVYLAEYARVKAKYAERWVRDWPEKTDPRKFVFEDLSIAAWLLCLWRRPSAATSASSRDVDEDGGAVRSVKFVDLGCGNGLLTHILSEEGHRGVGVDLASRKVWQVYGDQTQLVADALLPAQLRFSADTVDANGTTDAKAPFWLELLDGHVDWIIGNHADELVPWIPIIAARSNHNTKFAVIPCCFYTLDGQKRLKKEPGVSRYISYQRYLEGIMQTCGYEAERDQLRIPSTKNIAYVGRRRTFCLGKYAARLARAHTRPG
ncbi:hypothetical protein THASP1DRAFT_16734, partial [Thamnocephalis sphaerospora]